MKKIDNTSTRSNYSSLINIQDLFKNRYFFIPDYQRGYSWGKEQLEDLRKDIENMFNKNHKHFTGTIVAAKVGKSSNRYDIVDGQQRLMTLVILIKELIKQNPEEYDRLYNHYIERGSGGNKKLVFTPNEETRVCFEEIVIRNNSFLVEIKSHERIKFAKDYFSKWLSEENNKTQQITDIVTNKLGFLLYTPENDKEIGIMFEVINNRGKHLSELEKIKNYYIYYSTVHDVSNLRQIVNDKWPFIQKYLSLSRKTDNNDENSFLRNCYLVFFDPNKKKSWSVYKQLITTFDVNDKNKKTIQKNVDQMLKFVDFLTNAAQSYAYYFNADFFNSNFKSYKDDRISQSLKYLRSQPTNASIMPLYLAIMNRQDKLNEIAELLEILEKVNFRLYILLGVLNRADSKQGDLFYLAHDFFNKNYVQGAKYYVTTWYNEVKIVGDDFEWLKRQLIELTKYYCNEKKFVEVLTIDKSEDRVDYYRWQGIRYFLACYEEWLQNNKKHSWDVQQILASRKSVKTNYNDHLSIEHIWAKNNRSKDFPPNEMQKRRLGNFVLLGLHENIVLGNDDIPDKVDQIRQKTIISLQQIDELNQFYEKAKRYAHKKKKKRTKYFWSILSTKINDLRETSLIRFALDRWQLPSENFNKFVEVDSFKNSAEDHKYVMRKK